MNMGGGGGGMMKTVGRVIAGGGGRSPCSSRAQPLKSKRRTDQHQVEGGEAWLLKPSWADWEFVDRIVFRQEAPYGVEVAEAISDLEDAISLSINASQETFPESHGSISISQGNSAGVEVSPENNIESYKNAVDWIEPDFHSGIHGVVQPAGRSNVLDAFKLLKNDTVVQGMVKSLASDQAIWDAVLNNEKVLEFRKSLQNGEPKLEDTSKGSDNACDSNKPNLFTEAVANIKLKVSEYMEKITQLVHQILGFADNTFPEKDGDILDRTLKSSLMLTVAVLLVVLVKRAQKL